MSSDNEFTKQNLDMFLSELAKTFRKLNGNKIPAEIILISIAPEHQWRLQWSLA